MDEYNNRNNGSLSDEVRRAGQTAKDNSQRPVRPARPSRPSRTPSGQSVPPASEGLPAHEPQQTVGQQPPQNTRSAQPHAARDPGRLRSSMSRIAQSEPSGQTPQRRATPAPTARGSDDPETSALKARMLREAEETSKARKTGDQLPSRRRSDESDEVSEMRRQARESSAGVRSDQGGKQARRRAVPVEEPDHEEEGEETGSAIGRSMMNSTVKAIVYIMSVVLVSAFISFFAINIANDMFAFEKSKDEITVEIPDEEHANLKYIAKILHDGKVIKYPAIFKKYIEIRKKGADKYLVGSFTVSPSMGYDSLISTFKPSTGRAEISLTITEGMTVDDIINLFLDNGIGTREGFEETIRNFDYSDFWFIKEVDDTGTTDQRKYRLEGYLFPDTYNFYTDASESSVLYKMLDNFNNKFTEADKARAYELDLTVDEVITLASIIQKEAKYVSDYGKIASVFYNRMNSNRTNRYLQSDATVQYIFPEANKDLGNESLYDTPYNTYIYKGLPVGPITNPSLNAISYALYPDETDYFYFVSDKEGNMYYAETKNGHDNNIAMVEKINDGLMEAPTPETTADVDD